MHNELVNSTYICGVSEVPVGQFYREASLFQLSEVPVGLLYREASLFQLSEVPVCQFYREVSLLQLCLSEIPDSQFTSRRCSFWSPKRSGHFPNFITITVTSNNNNNFPYISI